YRTDNNVVEYIIDYLLNPNYGFGLSLDQLDRQSFIDAAIAVDRLPEYFDFDRTIFYFGGGFLSVFDRNEYMYGEAATTGASVNGSSFRTLNNGYDRQFRLDTGKTFISNLNQMLSSIGAIMFLSDGKFKIKLENAGDQDDSERIPPITALPLSATITDDDIIDSVGISTAALNDRFNQIKLDYTDLTNNSQPNSVLSPHPIEDSTDIRTNYLNEDGGKVLEGSFSFPGIFDSVTAQKHATLLLKKSRGQPVINFQAGPNAINSAPGDFIRVNSTALGINDVYRITDTTLNPDHTVVVSAIKHVPDFYDVTDTGQVFEAQRDILT
ncbi:MAG: phage tail protein, partial [Candidatus Poseidoniales archaeon]